MKQLGVGWGGREISACTTLGGRKSAGPCLTVRILVQVDNYWEGNIREVIDISVDGMALNWDEGMSISSAWTQTLKLTRC